jgi:flagellar basal body-associated protein FliL
MAADVAEQPKSAESAAHDAPASAKKKPTKILVVAGIVMLVIVVQIVVTMMLLPGHKSSGGGDHKSESKEHATDDHHGGGEGEGAEGEFAEVTLGDYSFSNSTAVPGIIIHVDFKLSAVATSKMASSLESQLKVHQMRVREKVNKIVRSSNLDELNDPNLGTIKRLIKEDINRLLRKTYVVEVIITDMRVMEQ